MAKEELVLQRHQFFSRCIELLRESHPRNYSPVRSLDKFRHSPSWYKFYELLDWVHFEWNFQNSKLVPGAGFAVVLNFQNEIDTQENQNFLKLFRSIKTRLEAASGEEVYFDPNRRYGWTRLCVWISEKKRKEMTDDELVKWAVEKAKVLIQECEPELKSVPGYNWRLGA